MSKPHNEIFLWKSLLESVQTTGAAILLLVVQHSGSSPGRGGFKMFVDARGSFFGSIGGGVMEHKLVELCKSRLENDERKILLKHQIHQAEAPANRSGMICSGEQWVALVPFHKDQRSLLQSIIQGFETDIAQTLEVSPEGISLTDPIKETRHFEIDQPHWRYRERLGHHDYLHIIGAGHVGLALSELAVKLEFHVTVYDDRPHLNTFELNSYAHSKKLVPYQDIALHLPEGPQHYVVIMTFGYRSDLLVLRSLLKKNYAYLGLLGSEAKIKTLFKQLIDEGADPRRLNDVDAPAGINIRSQSTHEIAVSIAASMISCRRQMAG